MLKYFVLISLSFILSKSLKTLLEYGEFDVKMTNIEICNGPKRRTCADFSFEIVNDVILKSEMNVKEDMKTVKGKIVGTLNGKELLRVQVKNLCDHIFLKPVIQSILNNSDHCSVSKGHYQFSVDMQTIARRFYGGKFIYGDWAFKWIFHAEYCNFQCATLYLTMSPKSD
ncbi:hypothetical protein B5X24_HaOG207200 [Helicoverpa armigera]|nr:hypothetical protein B5X24_HaOG207200 [Helicoverpa armigera]